MLRQIKIQNLVLVEKADIELGAGLNIITGETGAGKSAILSAIRLISGERADSQLIGNKGDIAIIEAVLDASFLPDEISLAARGEPITLRREMHRSGKNRCFVEDQQVSLSQLRQIGSGSIECIDAMSAATLCAPQEQRAMLDLFAQTTADAKAFADSFAEGAAMQKKLDELLQSQATRSRDLKWTEEDLHVIETVNWKIGEDETLSQQHELLTHAQTIQEKAGGACELLSSASLKRALPLLEGAMRYDPRIAPFFESLKTALLEIDEVAHELRSHLALIEADPQKLEKVEERISTIESLKRRFGKTIEEIEQKKSELRKKINHLLHLDEEVEQLRSDLQELTARNQLLAASLSERRAKASPRFALAVAAELKELNLPHAEFQVALSPQPLCSWGADEIHFLFSANLGHAPIPLEECASGGELSRLLLAIKTILAKEAKTKCLIFDEIDSNVGGHTAAILGAKLKQLAEHCQVICVTHFVQVAQCAMRHFVVSKSKQAVTTIQQIEGTQRNLEYERMLGGK